MYEITTIRSIPADTSHDHVELVGYLSPHIEGEPIMIDLERVAPRIALGDVFQVRVGEELLDLKVAPCPICDAPGQLSTAKDSKALQYLLALPRR